MISKGLSRPSEKNRAQWVPHLLEEYYAHLFALATSIVGPHWAEDVLQEVVIKLIRMGREAFEAKENSVGYLMIMVKNAALAMKSGSEGRRGESLSTGTIRTQTPGKYSEICSKKNRTVCCTPCWACSNRRRMP